jgi:ribosome assembly protein YihI (activator of Der GTPase)
MISPKGAGYDERGARNYIGNQRAQLSVGSRAKDPRQGSGDCVPLKLTTFYIMKRKF